MGERVIAEGIEKRPYFEAVTPVSMPLADDGTREMGELYPFLICGGTNTERYYFTHINDKTDYKFNIRPKYFGDESNYTNAFPKRIREVLSANYDAKIYCASTGTRYMVMDQSRKNMRLLRSRHQAIYLHA